MYPCLVCKNPIIWSEGGQKKKYCSVACRNAAFQARHGRKGLGLASGTTGAVSELLVAADLMMKGWEAYRAISPATFCDLLVMRRGSKETTMFLEVRTGYRSAISGKVSYPKSDKDKGKSFAIVLYEAGQHEIVYDPPITS